MRTWPDLRHARWLLHTCVLATSLGASAATTSPAPQTSQSALSGCSDVEGYLADEAGSFAVSTARCNGTPLALLSKRDPASATSEEQVLDRLQVRELKSGERFSSGPYCTAAGKEVRWVAIYRWGKSKRIRGKDGGVREAWVANLRTGRFEPAPEALRRSVICTANPDE
jgi:hypothetical protein